MMKSPRTPKMDITLKKPLVNLPNAKISNDITIKNKAEKSEVIPYYSRIKAMA